MKKISDLLDSAGLEKNRLDAVIVSQGPGSFTGLRIGIAVAKGMAAALNIPVMGVNMFELAAYKLMNIKDTFRVFVPFKKGEFFMGTIKEGQLTEGKIENVAMKNMEDVIGPDYIAGVGFDIFKIYPKGKKYPSVEQIDYEASDILFIGLEKLKKGLIPDLVTLEPMYIQKSQAEIKFEQRRQKK
jgi:tRNA threonylcarbamoyladenosine biosynthesis protein TsaB